MNITAMKQVATRSGSRILLHAKKVSPDVLVAAGVVGLVGATVLACRGTLKLENTVDNMNDDVEDFKRKAVHALKTESYSDLDYKTDLAKVYTKNIVEIVRLYAPSVILGSASIAAILGAHTIMKRRNAALAAAYTVTEYAFSEYRKRVAQEVGEEKEKEIRYSVEEKTVLKDSETSEAKVVPVFDADAKRLAGVSPYARFFDDTCTEWTKSADYNLTYLHGQQAYFNTLLRTQGHVFLNEVYDALGMPRSQAGALVGWVYGNPACDDFIDFGIYDIATHDTRAEFVNGYNPSILLDFNVQGPIYELI